MWARGLVKTRHYSTDHLFSERSGDQMVCRFQRDLCSRTCRWASLTNFVFVRPSSSEGGRVLEILHPPSLPLFLVNKRLTVDLGDT